MAKKSSSRGPTEGSRSLRGTARVVGGAFRLRGDLLAAGILASLRRWNAHGYRLGRELVKAGLPVLDSATLYRTLRELERAGLVSSFWDTSSSGPARRMYSLTKAGDVFLSGWIETLQRFQSVFQRAAEDVGASPADGEDGRSPVNAGPSASRTPGPRRKQSAATGAAPKAARRRPRGARTAE